jgi:GNAT superfamily N-acetyltransferase
MSDLEIVPLGEAEPSELRSVSERAGWSHTDDDWRAVARTGRVVGHRVGGRELVSTAVVFAQGPALASIGMVIVTPAWRGRGLAAALMGHCLSLAGSRPVILIATRFGFPLYQRLGFRTIAHVRRLSGTGGAARALGRPPAPVTVSALREDDVAAMYALDRLVVGVDRAHVLEARRAYAHAASALRDARDAVIGFTLATPQRGALVVGPLIAPDAASAAALVAHVAAGHAGPVHVDAPVEQAELATALGAAGFEVGPEAPLMMYRGDVLPGARGRLYGIVTRAVG